jgi:hypothetical protein
MKAPYIFALAAILLGGSSKAILAQQPTPSPAPAPTQELGFPNPNPPTVPPPDNSGIQGVSPPFAPLPLPGSSTAPSPIFSEPSTQSVPAIPSATIPLQPSLGTTAETPNISLVNLGPSDQVRFRFGGIFRSVYESNIFIQPNNEESDFYFNIGASIAVGKGNFEDTLDTRQATFLQPQNFKNADLLQPPSQPFIYLSYTPSVTAFIDHTGQDTFDHDVIGEGQIILGRLTLGAFGRFQTFSLPNSDIGGRLREQLSSGQGYAVYVWSPKTVLTSQLYLQNQENENFISFFEIWNEDWVDYKYSSKTSFGPGVAVGMVVPDAGPEQYYGRVQVRSTWKPTGKLSFAAKGGVEIRGVSGSGQKVYPIFGLEGRYAMSEKTSFTLSVFQQISSSADVEAINVVRRGVEAGLQQKIFDRYEFDFGVGYANSDYDDSLAQVTGGCARSDNTFYVHPRLTATINRWLESTVGVEYQNNSSSSPNRGYDDLSATCELRAKF